MKRTTPFSFLPAPLRAGIACLLFCLVALAGLHAQSVQATLTGTVSDQSGAMVPGVKVVVLNVATNSKRQTTTNKEGYFTVPQLEPGTYELRAQREGFASVEIPNIVLNTNDRRDLQIKLKVGKAADSITVEADSVTMNVSQAVSTVVDQRFVERMPLNGRTLQALISMTPGIVSDGAGGQFSANGQRTNSNYFTIDGVSANIGVDNGSGRTPGYGSLGTTNNLVSVDALQEFKIQTSNYAAEYGRSPGAQVQMVTRSGSNKFHGTAFDYLRNDVFDANDWFVNHENLKKAPLRQNNFGATFSGPIVRDRTFFFAVYEGMRLRLPITTIDATVPGVAQRRDVPDAIKPLVNALPRPTGVFAPDSYEAQSGAEKWSGTWSNPSRLDAGSIRVDHTVNQNLTLFGRYNYSPSSSAIRALSQLDYVDTSTTTITAGASVLLSPTMSSDIRVNWSRNIRDSFRSLDTFGGAVVPSDSVLFPAPLQPDSSQRQVIVGNAGFMVGRDARNTQNQWNIVGSVSKLAGTHSLKVGTDFRRMSPKFAARDYALDTLFWSQDSMMDLKVDNFRLQNRPASSVRYTNLSLFAQDTWKATPRLTLDYGIRWDYNPPPSFTPGLMPVVGGEDPATMTLAPAGTAPYPTIWTAFAPRVGASYQLANRSGWETIVRGGYGMFYNTGAGLPTGSFYPNFITVSRYGVPYPLDASVLKLPEVSLNPPYDGAFVGIGSDYALPRTHQWNLAVEQTLGSSNTLTMSYVGNAARRVLHGISLSSLGLLNPNFKRNAYMTLMVNSPESADTSDYHAMQVEYRRRAKNMQLLADYTWAHAIDTISYDLATNETTLRGTRAFDRASSDFDRRHLFNVAFSYDLPGLKGSTGAGQLLNAITRDWSVDTIYKLESGMPVQVAYQESSVINTDLSTNLRPNRVPGQPLWITDPAAPGGKKLNFAAFSIPATKSNGDAGRNAARGFGMSQLDLALRRQLNLTDRFKLQVKGEFFNLPNHPNFGQPSGFLGSRYSADELYLNESSFGLARSMRNRQMGRYTSVGNTGDLSPLYQMGGPRSMQFSLKLLF